jgi:hypothetical protein
LSRSVQRHLNSPRNGALDVSGLRLIFFAQTLGVAPFTEFGAFFQFFIYFLQQKDTLLQQINYKKRTQRTEPGAGKPPN